jgi:hypothetical protein
LIEIGQGYPFSRTKILSFKEGNESLATSWGWFNLLKNFGLDLALLRSMYYALNLSNNSTKSLDVTFGEAFLSLFVSEARFVFDQISGHTRIIKVHGKLLEKEKESSPKQEEEVLIVIVQPFKSHDMATNPKLLVLQNPPREEEILPLEIPSSDDFGRSLNLSLHKRPQRVYTSTPCKKRSLRKHLKGYLERLKNGMSSEAIEGE